jgi:Secretion system C-terminal sorting domain
MKNIFRHHIIILTLLFSVVAFSQDSKQQSIDGLNLYPNPVSNGKIYISSKTGENKDISIFDVLGKIVLQVALSTKELNIAMLSPGVYIIKIRENDATATRKLIIK